jgi:nucleotidyltransferase substrate binding protein (TIGR01987 family)
MALDLSNLKKALKQLETAIRVLETSGELPYTTEARETMRDGVIQRFEYTYELCWKFIQRWLRENRNPDEAVNPRTRKELFRLAAQCRLIEDPLPWFEYGEARNLTSHTYNMEQANSTYILAVKFASDAAFLLNRLEEIND